MRLVEVEVDVDATPIDALVAIPGERRGSRQNRLPIKLGLGLVPCRVKDLVADTGYATGSARAALVRKIDPAEVLGDKKRDAHEHHDPNNDPAIHSPSLGGRMTAHRENHGAPTLFANLDFEPVDL